MKVADPSHTDRNRDAYFASARRLLPSTLLSLVVAMNFVLSGLYFVAVVDVGLVARIIGPPDRFAWLHAIGPALPVFTVLCAGLGIRRSRRTAK